jgi:hypothetical protein
MNGSPRRGRKDGESDEFVNGVQAANHRDHDRFDPWGTCDGTSPYDKNDGVVHAPGTQTGPEGASHLTDRVKHKREKREKDTVIM